MNVVSATQKIVDTQNRFNVGKDVLARQKLTQNLGDDGQAAHAAANPYLEPASANLVFHQLQADVVEADGGTVGGGAGDGDLELARQPRELRVQSRPLTQ